MTTPDPIEAAIAVAIHAASDAFFTREDGADLQRAVRAAIRAAAPILIAAGREEAAKAIEDHIEADERLSNPVWEELKWAMYDAARIARGGTP